VEDDIRLRAIPAVKEFLYHLLCRFALRRHTDAAGEKLDRGFISLLHLEGTGPAQVRMGLSAGVAGGRRFHCRPRFELLPCLHYPSGMAKDKFPDITGCGAQGSPDQDDEVGVDGDAEGPAAGPAIAVGDMTTLPRHEVGEAFSEGRAACAGFDWPKRFLIHRRII